MQYSGGLLSKTFFAKTLPSLILNRKLNQVSDLKDLKKNQNEIFLRNVINLYDPLIKNFSHFITDYLPLIIQIEKQKEYKNLTSKIRALELDKTALEAKFLNPELSQDEISKLSEKLQVIIDTIEEKEMRWFELAEKLED